MLGGGAAAEGEGDAARVRVDAEALRLQAELNRLETRERGLLDEVDRLRVELRLRETELETLTLEIDGLNDEIDRRAGALAQIEAAQATRRRYLEFRLSRSYRAGRAAPWRRWLGDADADALRSGLIYAAHVSERDRLAIAGYLADAERLEAERGQLDERRAQLDTARRKVDESRGAVDAARAARSTLLAAVRRDQRKNRSALQELREAAEDLDRQSNPGTAEAGRRTEVDPERLRGRLRWPAQGPVSAGFGTIVHPRFGTEVPHPGIDIDAPGGSDIVAVAAGTLLFSDWMRGYGLTAIVDHGGGLVSIYAHASALIVGAGDQVDGGQLMGQVGETGSLRGPYLYFELRQGGKPVDPRGWLVRKN